jgi:DNA-directed RNA polymerase specialized sigma subunit
VPAQPEGGRSSSVGAEERRLRQQASGHAALSAVEEANLLNARPDPEALESLLRHNLDLVVVQADAHAGQGLGFPDLYQEGTIGLIDAIRAFDGGGKFRDFASLHIGLQMDALLEEEKIARQEADVVLEDSRTLDLAEVMLRRDLKRDPTPEELAQALGWDQARVDRVAAVLDEARRRNDELTLELLDESDLASLEEFPEPEADPYHRPPGAGPDVFE